MTKSVKKQGELILSSGIIIFNDGEYSHIVHEKYNGNSVVIDKEPISIENKKDVPELKQSRRKKIESRD